jgi:DNA-binding response OmpR family regulator
MHGSIERVEDARILVVDDQEMIVLLINRILEHSGFTAVTGTSDPIAARRLCETQVPDLLIVDLGMPALDGIEWLEELRPAARRPEPLAVLVVSGEDGTSERGRRARAAGASLVLSKPFRRADLVAAVREVLGA